MAAIIDHVRSTRPGTLIVAEKVETPHAHELAIALGCDLFQGYYFARPQLLSKSARPASAGAALALLAEIQRDDIPLERVEELIGSDPSLAYRVLAVVNSSAFGLDRRVDSLGHTIVLLGIRQVRHLTSLLTLSSATFPNEELITLGATRARFASLVVPRQELRSSAFTVGLLSVTDALYRTPLAEIVRELPLSDEVSEALVDGTGDLGEVMGIVRACEDADFDLLGRLAPGRIDEMRESYGQATAWADTLRRQLALGTGSASTSRLPAGASA